MSQDNGFYEELVHIMGGEDLINKCYVDNQILEFLQFLTGCNLRDTSDYIDIGYYIKVYFGTMTPKELQYVIKEIAGVAMKAGIDVSDELGPAFGVMFGEIFGNGEENQQD